MIGRVASNLLGLVGAALGAALGYALFQWLVSQNLYGLMIPGAMMGLGCCLLAQHRSHTRGIVCGIAALILGLYTEWRFYPFRADGGFQYLVVHFFDLKPITQLMLGVGAIFAYWIGKDASPLFSFAQIARNDQPAKPNSGRATTKD
ncbi:hypothetical protein [Singulisphaera acidiphila]|uniref:Uncharacterized protein n=1 Tax=Singulisphaera acidiphila (strain ATCC BAA-1392 / DSM 18658 / VKM B-2454 / MOB10) TaxID=886293 RepID=L0DL30_SINAD|nr:hypothetical protein [Singulisphaera acidiphila]AGA29563.1 hypothetical protein Sinac_5415 [Singulisphaera acidiphila DSM 18658]